jgi:hypothetical protein
MKVLGVDRDSYKKVQTVIVEMSQRELLLIVNGGYSDTPQTSQIEKGFNVSVCDRFQACAKLERTVKDAANVGESLRAMAAAVDAVVKSASEVILPPKAPAAGEESSST